MNLKVILGRGLEKISSDRKERLFTAGMRTSNNYVENLKKERELLIEKIEDLLDLSARADANAGISKLTNKEIESVITQYHEKREELHLLDQRIKVAMTVNAELDSVQTPDVGDTVPIS